MNNSILIPGGLGYIGSHTVLDIYLHTQFKIIIVDNLSNCTESILDKIKIILSEKATLEEINSRLFLRIGNVLDL
jgi:UDP-glucose 4-epimerase